MNTPRPPAGAAPPEACPFPWPCLPLAAGEAALITPLREPGERPLPPTVLMTCTKPDFQELCQALHGKAPAGEIFGCSLRAGLWQGVPLTVAAPAVGAPLAAMVLEKLIALGARRVFLFGWCGSVSSRAPMGTLILPEQALPGDGTSPHYQAPPQGVFPDPGLQGVLRQVLKASEVPWVHGPVLSLDAFYRETPTLVRLCQARGILALDMEFAALLAVGRYRGVKVAGVLWVSDELFDLEWRPARGNPAFRQARRKALRLLLEAAIMGEADG